MREKKVKNLKPGMKIVVTDLQTLDRHTHKIMVMVEVLVEDVPCREIWTEWGINPAGDPRPRSITLASDSFVEIVI